MVRWGWMLSCLAFAVCASLIPREAQAHPLGNFTINHYSSLQFTEENARITYVLNFAEIPTLQQKARLDADGDGKLSEEEANAYLEAEIPSLVEGLRLRAGDEILPLQVRIARRSTDRGRVDSRPCGWRLISWPTFRRIGGVRPITPIRPTRIVLDGGRSWSGTDPEWRSRTLRYGPRVCRTNFAPIREICSPARPKSARPPSRSFLATGRSRTRLRAGRRSASERASAA